MWTGQRHWSSSSPRQQPRRRSRRGEWSPAEPRPIGLLMNANRLPVGRQHVLAMASGRSRRKLPHVGDAAGERGGGGCLRAHEMGAHLRSLAVLEVAIRGGDAALARRAAIAVSPRAHGAAGFAPEEAGIAEDAVEAFRL